MYLKYKKKKCGDEEQVKIGERSLCCCWFFCNMYVQGMYFIIANCPPFC